MKLWSNILGVSFTKNVTDTPIAGYTEMVYGDGTKLLGFSALDVGHTVPVRSEDDLVWFGLMPGSSSTTSTKTSTVSSTKAATSSTTKVSTTLKTITTTSESSTTSATSTAAHWAQW